MGHPGQLVPRGAKLVFALALLLAWTSVARAQAAPAAAPDSPALARSLFSALQSLQGALAQVTPEQWRAKDSARVQFRTDRASIERNVVEALPGLALKLENAPEDLGAAFRLYRDGEAVYAVALRAADLASRYGDKARADAIAAALQQTDASLDALADFIQVTGSEQAAELARFRTAHPDAPPASAPPKTLVINDANGPAPSRHSSRSRAKKAKPAPKQPQGGSSTLPAPPPTPPPPPGV